MRFVSSRLSQTIQQDILELSRKLELTHTGSKIATSLAAEHTYVQVLQVTVTKAACCSVHVSLPREHVIINISPEACHDLPGSCRCVGDGEQMIPAGLSVFT